MITAACKRDAVERDLYIRVLAVFEARADGIADGRAFDDAFERYLDKAESVGVKTTAMGSMFRLSYRIRIKDPSEEKAFIDELRVRNGNLEISVLPFTEQTNQL